MEIIISVLVGMLAAPTLIGFGHWVARREVLKIIKENKHRHPQNIVRLVTEFINGKEQF